MSRLRTEKRFRMGSMKTKGMPIDLHPELLIRSESQNILYKLLCFIVGHYPHTNYSNTKGMNKYCQRCLRRI